MASEDAAGIIDLYQRKASDWIESRARTRLIEKGKQVAGEYTNEKAAELLWQSIIKALD